MSSRKSPRTGKAASIPANGDGKVRNRIWLAAGVIVTAGVLVYINSFAGVPVFDDGDAVVQNRSIRDLGNLETVFSPPHDTTVAGRPVINLSLAINYAISGPRLWSYHALNLLVHLSAGLLLFGVARRTFLSDRLRGALGAHATALAGVIGLLWVVHPIQTQAVTYIVQRAESIACMFILLTLYCAIRSSASARPAGWQAAAVVACCLGMASKEMAAATPLLVLAYDRIFMAGSLREVFRKRWPMYLGLMASWGILAGLMAQLPRAHSTGFDDKHTAWRYACTQFGVIVHYLVISFWPANLCLDWLWPLAKSPWEAVPPAIVVAALLIGTVLALWRWPAAGFLGLWFFAILAPTSSFVPIADPCFDHRMYLPLAAVIAGTVVAAFLAGRYLLSRLAPNRAGAIGAALAWTAVMIAAVGLGNAAIDRNAVFGSTRGIWLDVIAKAPHNYRAWSSLAMTYNPVTEARESKRCMDRSFIECPNADARFGQAILEATQGNFEHAVSLYKDILANDRGHFRAMNNLAWLLATLPNGSLRDGTRAVELASRACELTNWRDTVDIDTLAAAYAETGQFDKAIEMSNKAISLAMSQNGFPADALADLDGRAKLYRRHLPYRETPGQTAGAK